MDWSSVIAASSPDLRALDHGQGVQAFACPALNFCLKRAPDRQMPEALERSLQPRAIPLGFEAGTNCATCGTNFKGKRKDARFCSAKMRQWLVVVPQILELRCDKYLERLDLRSRHVGAASLKRGGDGTSGSGQVHTSSAGLPRRNTRRNVVRNKVSGA